MNHWTLEQISGPELGDPRIAVSRSLALGRGPDNDIVLADRGVSRQHLLLEPRPDGSLWLTDLGSRAGTERNRRRVPARHPLRLESGDLIAIGPWRLLAEAPGGSLNRLQEEDLEAETVLGQPADLGSLAEQRLKLMLDFAARLGALEDRAGLIELLAEYALVGSGYARSVVLTLGQDNQPRLLCQRPEPEPGSTAAPISSALLRAAGERDLALLEAPSGHSQPGFLRRALCVALVGGDGEAPLYLYLDLPYCDPGSVDEAPALCLGLARLAALSLSRLARRESERRRRALEAELEGAREVQSRIVPASIGSWGSLEHAVVLRPGSSVAGDLADVFRLPDGRLALLLGDVAGSGLGAGLVMSSVQAFLRAAMQFETDPAQVLVRLNEHLVRHGSGGRFVTLWLGVFAEDGSGSFVDAGHGHALRLGAGAPELLASEGGIPLGVMAEAPYRTETLQLAPGEGLLLYSDGLVEQSDAEGQPFGLDGIRSCLHNASQPGVIVADMLAALDDHRGAVKPEDDTTILVLRRSS